MIEGDLIDRRDGGLGVGIGGEQHRLCLREDLLGLNQELGSGHLRHPLVGDEHRDGVSSGEQVSERFERLGAGWSTHHPVVLAVAVPQVTSNGGQHLRVIVDSEDGSLSHVQRVLHDGESRVDGTCNRMQPSSE